MKILKLNLEEIKVKSFVTSTETRADKAQDGGFTWIS